LVFLFMLMLNIVSSDVGLEVEFWMKGAKALKFDRWAYDDELLKIQCLDVPEMQLAGEEHNKLELKTNPANRIQMKQLLGFIGKFFRLLVATPILSVVMEDCVITEGKDIGFFGRRFLSGDNFLDDISSVQSNFDLPVLMYEMSIYNHILNSGMADYILVRSFPAAKIQITTLFHDIMTDDGYYQEIFVKDSIVGLSDLDKAHIKAIMDMRLLRCADIIEVGGLDIKDAHKYLAKIEYEDSDPKLCAPFKQYYDSISCNGGPIMRKGLGCKNGLNGMLSHVHESRVDAGFNSDILSHLNNCKLTDNFVISSIGDRAFDMERDIWQYVDGVKDTPMILLFEKKHDIKIGRKHKTRGGF
jgi:hypothetical protein